MLKKILLTTAAALAITTGAFSIGASDANAGVKLNVTFGHGWHGGHHNFHGSNCIWKKKRVRISYWHHGHKHKKWVWKSYPICY